MSINRDELMRLNDAAIEKLVGRFELERAMLYRAGLRCSVRLASPLLLDLLAGERISPIDVVNAMNPPPGWPEAARPLPFSAMIRRLKPGSGKAKGMRAVGLDQRFARCLAQGGVVVRAPSDRGGAFGVWASAGTLHAFITLGSSHLAIAGSEARLTVPELPDLLASAMPGRDLGNLFDHPLLCGRGYMVRRVLTEPDRAPVLVFGCGFRSIDLTRSDFGDAR